MEPRIILKKKRKFSEKSKNFKFQQYDPSAIVDNQLQKTKVGCRADHPSKDEVLTPPELRYIAKNSFRQKVLFFKKNPEFSKDPAHSLARLFTY